MSQENKLQYDSKLSDEEKVNLALTMLDSNFDDIADLPDFVNLPVGSFLVDVTRAEAGRDGEGGDVVIKIVLEVVDTLELAKYPNVPGNQLPEGEAPQVGSLTSYRFQGALGIARFKKVFGDTPIKLGATTPSQFIEILATGAVRGMAITTSQRADKTKVDVLPDGTTKPKMYSELVTAALLG